MSREWHLKRERAFRKKLAQRIKPDAGPARVRYGQAQDSSLIKT